MKPRLTYLLLLFALVSFRSDDDIHIKAVKLRFKDEIGKVVFDNYKDCKVDIDGLTLKPLSGNLSLKIGGYYELEYASLRKYTYDLDDTREVFTYYFDTAGDAIVSVTISNNPVTDKMNYVLIVGPKNPNIFSKKLVSFTLTGFE